MSQTAISVKGLYRSFGALQVLDGLEFSVDRGSVAGFIGENGAGKTTTMRILATLDLPDSGEVHVGGMDLVQDSLRIRPILGWMPDSYDRHPFMTVIEYLDFFARGHGLRGALRTERIRDVLEFTEMGPLQERFIDVLSKGQSQRLCLARTLLNDPEVLVLDEPAAGLDPKARVEFKHLVRELASAGKTLFISSHILSELEDMCDKLIFLKDGRVLHEGTAEGLKNSMVPGTVIDIRAINPVEKVSEWVSQQPGMEVLEQIKHGVRVRFESREHVDLAGALRRMIADGIEVIEFRRHEKKLEDAFIELVSGSSSRVVSTTEEK